MNEIIGFADAILRDNLVAGTFGLPFRYSSSGLFGESKVDWTIWAIDMFFWLVILLFLYWITKLIRQGLR